MKKKQILIAKIFLAALFFTSCNQTKVEDLENQLSECQEDLENLQNKILAIQTQASHLESAVNELKGEVGDFSYENWRTNVPEVEYATENVENELNNLLSEVQ